MVLKLFSLALIVASYVVPRLMKVPRKTGSAALLLGLAGLQLPFALETGITVFFTILASTGLILGWQAWTEWQEQRVIDRGHAAAERGTKPGA